MVVEMGVEDGGFMMGFCRGEFDVGCAEVWDRVDVGYRESLCKFTEGLRKRDETCAGMVWLCGG